MLSQTENASLRILVLNPTPRTTQVALYQGREQLERLCQEDLHHSPEELAPFERVWDQYLLRKSQVTDWLLARGIRPADLSAVVGRGGLLHPVEGGTYAVNQAMLEDLRRGSAGEHASNLGGILAYGIARSAGIPAYVVDPPTTDEMEPVAHLSGLPELPRRSVLHTLNMRAAGRLAAQRLGRSYEEVRLIIAHLGAGISVALHRNGRIVDTTDALESGPFSPERAGTLPVGDLVRLCFSGHATERELHRMLTTRAGLVAHLGTNDVAEVEARVQAGDEQAALVLEAMAYQVSREIGAMAGALGARPDGVVLTGPDAASDRLAGWITERVSWLGPVLVFPGGHEMEALAYGALRVLRGEEEPRLYQ